MTPKTKFNWQELPSKLAGISVIYFTDEQRNVHCDLPTDKDLAKQIAGHIFRDVKVAISQKERAK